MFKVFGQISKNLSFVAVFAGIIFLMVLIAYLIEYFARKKNGGKERILSTRKIVVIGMFSALSTILMLLEFPVPFAPPGIYKLDFSELPALIGGFAFGPVAGVLIELVKILLKTLIKGTSTAFVGELANFIIGCSFVLPASAIYMLKKSKITAVISCVVGTIVITVAGSMFNALYLLPTFAKMFNTELSEIVAMGTAVNKFVTDVPRFALLIVAPVNLLKGVMVSLPTLLIYKPLSPILKGTKTAKSKKKQTES
ncbi:MAG: ECF transporter S component [Lachnospiraceae bacterium]|nr:ECF transporter S component [Lachnospiraceae bacterium]